MQASLEIASRWKQVEATNLWVKIPAADPFPVDTGKAPGVFVLSAVLDTFGAVPDICPELRGAANCALLGEVAIGLSKQRLRRSVYAVFLGSHFAAQDGARAFYYPYGKAAAKPDDPASLTMRAKDLCQGSLDRISTQLGMLPGLDFVTDTSDVGLDLNQLAHNHVVGQEADDSYDINQVIQQGKDAKDALLEMSDHASKEAVALEHQIQSLNDQVAALRQDKKDLNHLRRQLGNSKVEEASDFISLRAWLHDQLMQRQQLFTRLMDEVHSDQEIAGAFSCGPALKETVLGHFDLDLSNATDHWMFSPFTRRGWAYSEPTADGFGKQRKAFEVAIGHRPAPHPWFADESIDYNYALLSVPHLQTMPICAAIGQGIPSFELLTLGDAQNSDEMPVRASCQLQGLAAVLTEDLGTIIASQALPQESGVNASTFSERLMIGGTGTALTGMTTIDRARGSDLTECTARDAILLVGSLNGGPRPSEPDYSLGGISMPFCRIDPTGHVLLPGIIELPGDQTKAACQAFGFNGVGTIERFTPNGAANGDLAQLIFGTGGGLFTPFRPQDYLTGSAPSVLIARRDSSPTFMYSACFAQREVVYFNATQPIKAIGDGLDVLCITKKWPHGAGISLDPDDLLRLDIDRQSGQDLSLLNLERLKLLREKNIINKPLEKLQADDQEEVDSAAQDAKQGKISSASAHSVVSSILGNIIHFPLLDTAGDLVNAVLILLVLSVPFSFALERLLFGATSIYKQVIGFISIFFATFGILYLTHPAFALAEAPIIIFLAFVIIILSGFTTFIMMGKFKYELRALQGLSSKTHGDQSEGGTAFAAISIGISGMRNRPLKTLLTASTVALLTFTILVFASFSSTLAVVATPLGTARGVHRIEFHLPSFMDMPQRLLATVSSVYGAKYEVVERGSSFDNPLLGAATDDAMHADEGVQDIAYSPASLSMQRFQALLVVDPTEVGHLDPLFGPLQAQPLPAAGSELPPIMVSQTVAEKLKVSVGSEIRIHGQSFRLAGTFIGKELKKLENIDGTRLLPPDFTATFMANASHFDQTNGASNAFKQLDVNNFVFTQADLVALTTPQGMANIHYEHSFITLYPRKGVDADIDADAHDLAQWLDGPVSACSDHGTSSYFFTDAVEGSGFSEVLVPLLLGGLIIFSSLLGSIVDRQKEIFTYSALGLAPPDVAALFFAESSVFAVIGGMGGYLISQLVVKVLTILAGYGLATVPDVNFSSLWSILTILVVMLTVILSTIYPALMAGRSANPGVARKWRMPKPEGDTLRFTFPFTVSAESIKGILAFIREHFQNHGDASLGSFAARDVKIIHRQGEGGRTESGISAEIALSPFDLGVVQSFTMLTRASDIPGIDEVVVELVRLNGAPNTWIRSNRAFIDDLREQFLRWRSLSIDTVEHYHRLAEGIAGGLHA